MVEIQPVKKLIDIKGAFNRLRRRVRKCIYLNENCFIKLRPVEMERISVLLLALYDDHLLHKGDTKYRGIKQENLSKCFIPYNKDKNARDRLVRVYGWMLAPQFVFIRSIGTDRDARKFKLNEYGVQLVELLIEDAKKKEENQNIAEQKVEEDVLDEEELEEEENVSEDN